MNELDLQHSSWFSPPFLVRLHCGTIASSARLRFRGLRKHCGTLASSARLRFRGLRLHCGTIASSARLRFRGSCSLFLSPFFLPYMYFSSVPKTPAHFHSGRVVFQLVQTRGILVPNCVFIFGTTVLLKSYQSRLNCVAPG